MAGDDPMPVARVRRRIVEAEGGRLVRGLRADVTVLGADPLSVAADELPDVPVRLTVSDGEIVHRAPDA